MGDEARPQPRVQPVVLGAGHRRRACRDRGADRADGQAHRRHRPAHVRDHPERVRPHPGPGRRAPDQPDPPRPRHRQRRVPVRARLPGRRPAALPAAVRLAPALLSRAPGKPAVLPRPRRPHGHPRHPRVLFGPGHLVRRVRRTCTLAQRRRRRYRAGDQGAPARPHPATARPHRRRARRGPVRRSAAHRGPGARPAWPARAFLHGILRARATALRWFGRPRSVALFADGIPNSTYPDGYEISRLGPA